MVDGVKGRRLHHPDGRRERSVREAHRDPDGRLQDAEGMTEGRVRSEEGPEGPAGSEYQAAITLSSAPKKEPASAGFLFYARRRLPVKSRSCSCSTGSTSISPSFCSCEAQPATAPSVYWRSSPGSIFEWMSWSIRPSRTRSGGGRRAPSSPALLPAGVRR